MIFVVISWPDRLNISRRSACFWYNRALPIARCPRVCRSYDPVSAYMLYCDEKQRKGTRVIRHLFGILVLILSCAPAYATTWHINPAGTSETANRIYVKHDAAGLNNGTSWTDAYTNLQAGFGNASSGDTIWVAAGTYVPTTTTTATTRLIHLVKRSTFIRSSNRATSPSNPYIL